MGDALKLWATETNKFYHCMERDLFAAIFPTLSQYCTPEQISINNMDKSHISRIGAKQVKMDFYGIKKWTQREDQGA
jgi:hypothetical protein